MKKQKLKKLSINKESISQLNSDSITGGNTTGCTDGCSILQTITRCTQANCTADCDDGLSWLCTIPLSALSECMA